VELLDPLALGALPYNGAEPEVKPGEREGEEEKHPLCGDVGDRKE
jgi:hypothetical protein